MSWAQVFSIQVPSAERIWDKEFCWDIRIQVGYLNRGHRDRASSASVFIQPPRWAAGTARWTFHCAGPLQCYRVKIAAFDVWQLAFHTFMAIFLFKHQIRWVELVKYGEIICSVLTKSLASGWQIYDKQFHPWSKRPTPHALGANLTASFG